MKIPENLGSHWWSDYLFNPETCQLAYKRSPLLPKDDGYYKGMEGFLDYENDKCIVRHFDNAGITIRLKGFYYIVDDSRFDKVKDYDSLPLSEVKRIMEANKPTKPKIYAKMKKTQEKKQALMEQAIKIARSINESEDHLVVRIFALTDVVRKNLFTPQDLHDFINKTK
jgi:hypothetical protein